MLLNFSDPSGTGLTTLSQFCLQFALVGGGLVRETLWPFGEFVPNADTNINPCNEFPYQDQDFVIQKSLSCIAQENDIYVGANMIDIQPCNECGEDKYAIPI